MTQSTAEEARDLANDISATCMGHSTTAVFIAMAMMIGRMASLPEKPDFDGLMELIKAGAHTSFLEGMAMRGQDIQQELGR